MHERTPPSTTTPRAGRGRAATTSNAPSVPHPRPTRRSTSIQQQPRPPAAMRTGRAAPGPSSAASSSSAAAAQTSHAPNNTNSAKNEKNDKERETQRRIAARAATAMAQVRQRQPRSFLLWGDKRKAVIKRYPDGSQEILVPQSLTNEQEQYEFPPRSRLLKKLASSTAERQRLSSLQTNIVQEVPPPTTTGGPPEPDQGALAEWFAKRKDKAVMDWMSHIPSPSHAPAATNAKRLSSRAASVASAVSSRHHSARVPGRPTTVAPNPLVSPNSSISPLAIHLQSRAGKRWLRDESTASRRRPLQAPDEHTRVHHVKRHLLQYRVKQKLHVPPPAASSTSSLPRYSRSATHVRAPSFSASLLAAPRPNGTGSSPSPMTMQTRPMPIHRASHHAPRDTSTSSTTQKTTTSPPTTSSSSNMLQLVQMFHKTLQEQQARAHQRLKQLECLIQEERFHREDLQRTQQLTIAKLDSLITQYQPPQPPLSNSSPPTTSAAPTTDAAATTTTTASIDVTLTNPSTLPLTPSSSSSWTHRLSMMEQRLEHETILRQQWEKAVQDRIDALHRSVSTHTHDHASCQRQLQDQISQALKNLSSLTHRS
ncbi:hypothetical protein BC940DRAFT_108559 [Gongronella butleri]|nr:hypothetical protein BC940DRAFT_108559 [Gongronella butleri]